MKSRKTKEQKIVLLDALEKSLGNITLACKMSNVKRSDFYNYKNNDKEFASKVVDIRDAQIDFVEAQLIKGIKDGSATLIKFYLSTKGKNRGYSEKIEIEQTIKQDLSLLTNEQIRERINLLHNNTSERDESNPQRNLF